MKKFNKLFKKIVAALSVVGCSGVVFYNSHLGRDIVKANAEEIQHRTITYSIDFQQNWSSNNGYGLSESWAGGYTDHDITFSQIGASVQSSDGIIPPTSDFGSSILHFHSVMNNASVYTGGPTFAISSSSNPGQSFISFELQGHYDYVSSIEFMTAYDAGTYSNFNKISIQSANEYSSSDDSKWHTEYDGGSAIGNGMTFSFEDFMKNQITVMAVSMEDASISLVDLLVKYSK